MRETLPAGIPTPAHSGPVLPQLLPYCIYIYTHVYIYIYILIYIYIYICITKYINNTLSLFWQALPRGIPRSARVVRIIHINK